MDSRGCYSTPESLLILQNPPGPSAKLRCSDDQSGPGSVAEETWENQTAKAVVGGSCVRGGSGLEEQQSEQRKQQE